jgi:predicted CXXCH cytochrome family protein
MSGPYIYPHPPRAIDGCVQCHTAHGTLNPMMLNRPTVAQQCLECHTALTQRHDITRPMYQNCQNCHIGIHGSNHNRYLLDE